MFEICSSVISPLFFFLHKKVAFASAREKKSHFFPINSELYKLKSVFLKTTAYKWQCKSTKCERKKNVNANTASSDFYHFIKCPYVTLLIFPLIVAVFFSLFLSRQVVFCVVLKIGYWKSLSWWLYYVIRLCLLRILLHPWPWMNEPNKKREQQREKKTTLNSRAKRAKCKSTCFQSSVGSKMCATSVSIRTWTT